MKTMLSKGKKVLASVLILALVLTHLSGSGAAFGIAVASVDERIIYTLSGDLLVQQLADGTTGSQVISTPHLQGSGSPVFTVVPNLEGGNAIQVSGRGADWNTVDLTRQPLGLEVGNLYAITVRGRVPDAPAGTQFIIGGASSPFNWAGNGAPDAAGNFEVTAVINHERLTHPQFTNGFRLQTNNTATYILDEIEVRYIGTDTAWTPPPPEPQASGNVLRIQGEGVYLPMETLSLQAGNRYELFVDLQVPSVTATDVVLTLYSGNVALITTNTFRSHPGFHDPTYTGPSWRRYEGVLDLTEVTDIPFENLTLVATAIGDTRNLVYRMDNFTITHADEILYAFDFESNQPDPFIPFAGTTVSLVPNVDTRVWHDIRFDEDWAIYQNHIVSHNTDIMIGERVDRPGSGGAFRLHNAPNTSFTNSQNRSMRFDLPTAIPVGAHVEVSWDVYVPTVGNEGVNRNAMIAPGLVVNRFAGSPELQPTNNIPAPGDLNRRIPWDEWVTTTTTFSVTAFTEQVESLFFRFRADAASGNNQPHVLYIDNVVITVTIADEPYIPTWETKLNLPSLAENFADYFLFGQILEPPLFNDEALMDAFFHHYNSVTAENAMKPDTISGGASLSVRPEELNLTNARAFVNLAEANDLHIVGHALVWHEQSSIWMHGDAANGFHTRAEAMENLRWFIASYAGYFEGRIDAWDVANEVVTTNGGDEPATAYAMFNHPVPAAGSWQRRMRATVPWFRAFSNEANFENGERGWDYIYYAYVFARTYAPGALLIYNDFNEETPNKRDAMAEMVEYFNARWAVDAANNPAYGNPNHPDYGRLLIEVIGMQAHYNNNTNLNNVRAAIERFAQTGARIHVTELDIHFNAPMAGQGGWMTPAQLEHQANMYRQLFQWYLEFANYIDRVTLWGRDDMSSWRSAGAPTLFDRNLNPKPAFFAVLDPFGGGDWPAPPARVIDIVPTAFVTQTPGNTNDLTIIVTYYYSDGTTRTVEETFVIRNNASGTFNVGNHFVFVNTQGNTQIRGIWFVE